MSLEDESSMSVGNRAGVDCQRGAHSRLTSCSLYLPKSMPVPLKEADVGL